MSILNLRTEQIVRMLQLFWAKTGAENYLCPSFFWCMYGETSFADKKLLNTKVANQMLPNETKDVRVTLWLKHGLNDYMLVRNSAILKQCQRLLPEIHHLKLR